MSRVELDSRILQPYPGLRQFLKYESEIFFGREEHVEALIQRLETRRFLAVVGPSGCGKSSLVTAGLLPFIESGFVGEAGPDWRIAHMRPGNAPFRRLADALLDDSALGRERGSDPNARGFLDATLRRGPLGLIEAIAESSLAAGVNVMLLVDQFEEIFRYRREIDREEAEAFINLLLASASAGRQHTKIPVYVILTMRSDYLGDCCLFKGLPEELNDSQFLTPRLTRDQMRGAIVGPARVFESDLADDLVNQLLNDVGGESDQLPLLQHALMRMWTRSLASPDKNANAPPRLTLEDYLQVGGIANALSNHADEAYGELAQEDGLTAERMFRQLAERSADQRDIRRPLSLEELSEAIGQSVKAIMRVADSFRRRDRCFLMPPLPEPLEEATVLDISHESLIRQWRRLKSWVEQEARSAETFTSLQAAGRRMKSGRDVTLWSEGQLSDALAWKNSEKPTAAWAERYGGDFDLATRFLDASEVAQRQESERREATRMAALTEARQRAEEEARRAANEAEKARRFQFLSLILGGVLLIAVVLAVSLFLQRSARRSAESSVEELRRQAATVAAEKTTLDGQVQELGRQRDSLQLDRDQLDEDSRLLRMNVDGLERERRRIALANETLSAVAAASGIARKLEDGTYELRFEPRLDSIDDAVDATVRFAKSQPVTELTLQDTPLTDDHLTRVAEIKPLRRLDLSETLVTDAGLAKLAALGSLQWLDVAGSRITDPGLAALGNLGGLRSVDVSYNRVNPQAVAALEERIATRPGGAVSYTPAPLLERWAAHDETVQGLESAIKELGGSMDSVSFVDLAETDVTDYDLRVFELLPAVREIDLWRASRITMKGAKHLRHLRLTRLNLQDTKVSDEGLALLSTQAGLAILDLGDTRVTETGMQHIGKLVGLRDLNLGGSGTNDVGVGHLARLTLLASLDLGLTRITDRGTKVLSALTSLRELVLTNNYTLGNDALSNISSLQNLTRLDLQGSRTFSDQGLQHVSKLSNLQELAIPGDRNDFTVRGFAELAKLAALRDLALFDFSLDGQFMLTLAQIRSLDSLRLWGCKISQEGYTLLGSLSNLKRLQFQGITVPSETVAQLRRQLPGLEIDFVD